MAYTAEYEANIKSLSGVEYTLQILKSDYTGSTTTIKDYDLFPLEIKYNGNEEEDYIAGSELSFTFYSLSADTFNNLFTSNYKDYRIDLYKSLDLVWSGWLKPENMRKKLIGDSQFITISATDGISDLKNIEYPLIVDLSAKVSLINVITSCLALTNIELPIKIQNNTIPIQLTGTTEQSLEKVKFRISRISKIEDGIVKNRNAYEVLEEVLKLFDCRIIQAEGTYLITNKFEKESYRYNYLFGSNKYNSRSLIDNVKDISNNKFADEGQLTKIAPKKTYELTFENKSSGDNIISLNPNDWNYSGTTVFDISGNTISIYAPFPNPNDGAVFWSNPFYVEKLNDDDKLILSFSYSNSDADTWYLLDDSWYYYRRINIYIKYPSSNDYVLLYMLSAEENYFNSALWNIDIKESGNYQFKFEILYADLGQTDAPPSTYTFKDFTVYPNYIQSGATTTFDKLFIAINGDSTAINKAEEKIILGDSYQAIDEGALFYVDGVTLTNKWQRYDNADNISLIAIKAKNKLRNYKDYKNKIRIEFDCSGNTYNFNTVIKLNDKYYWFNDYSYDIVRDLISAELQELLYDNVNITIFQANKNSVDGVAQSSNARGVIGGGTSLLLNEDFFTKTEVNTCLNKYMIKNTAITGTTINASTCLIGNGAGICGTASNLCVGAAYCLFATNGGGLVTAEFDGNQQISLYNANYDIYTDIAGFANQASLADCATLATNSTCLGGLPASCYVTGTTTSTCCACALVASCSAGLVTAEFDGNQQINLYNPDYCTYVDIAGYANQSALSTNSTCLGGLPANCYVTGSTGGVTYCTGNDVNNRLVLATGTGNIKTTNCLSYDGCTLYANQVVCTPTLCATLIKSTGNIEAYNGCDLVLNAAANCSDSGDIVFKCNAGAGEWARIWTSNINGCLCYRNACDGLTSRKIFTDNNISEAQINATIITSNSNAYTISASNNNAVTMLSSTSSPAVVWLPACNATTIGQQGTIVKTSSTGSVLFCACGGVTINSMCSYRRICTAYNTATYVQTAACTYLIFGGLQT